jgi:hypothetical protein
MACHSGMKYGWQEKHTFAETDADGEHSEQSSAHASLHPPAHISIFWSVSLRRNGIVLDVSLQSTDA